MGEHVETAGLAEVEVDLTSEDLIEKISIDARGASTELRKFLDEP